MREAYEHMSQELREEFRKNITAKFEKVKERFAVTPLPRSWSRHFQIASIV